MPEERPRRAIFLDRDGTLTREIGYMTDVSRLELLPRTAAAVERINRSGFLAVLTTNQSGVARGLFPEGSVRRAHARLRRLLSGRGAYLDAVYYCPHHPSEGQPPYRRRCECRKPRTGLPERAAHELGLELETSYVIGDTRKDLEMARRVEATGVLVLTGYGRGEWQIHRSAFRRPPDFIAGDLLDAVEWILERESRRTA